MSCRAATADRFDDRASAPVGSAADELRLASRDLGQGLHQTDLSVPDMHCGGCIARIERALDGLPGVVQARVNLSTRRVAVRWRVADGPPPLVETLARLGYAAHVDDGAAREDHDTLRELVRAMAVAGFAAGNIMLLSVAVWSGADPATRDVLHGLSACIALPTLAYSGRVFFRSAWSALRHGRTNMDVPISIGVLLAFAMSLYDTLHGGAHTYFDAAVMLLFFLLVGRTLDRMMRERARSAVEGLARLAARGALVRREDGTHAYLAVAHIEPGMAILLAAGERVPLDAVVEEGRSELDVSLVTGESVPQSASPGTRLQAGTLNLTGPLVIRATAPASRSFVAEMMRLMEAAEAGRGRYRRIADRAARLYAPCVHAAALLSFAGWLVVTGDTHRAVTIAVAVLIITCPCALGLAVPMVQVVAARRLFERQIMVKDGSALERLAEIDTVVLDKTGTLTLGRPLLANAASVTPDLLALAAAIAVHSRHPYASALAAAAGAAGSASPRLQRVAEEPGLGLEAVADGAVYRLGRPEWALDGAATLPALPEGSLGVLARDGALLAAFTFEDALRPDARAAVEALQASGVAVEMLSGDRPAPVRRSAVELGIADAGAGLLPADKVRRIAARTAEGRKVLMVGDGLNDAPALAAAHASMAPAAAADVGRNVADLVFLREELAAVPFALTLARRARRLVRQNLGLAILYNAIALPLAVLGQVTPLVAALAMSASSVLVVANALRLHGGPAAPRPAVQATAGTLSSWPRVAVQ